MIFTEILMIRMLVLISFAALLLVGCDSSTTTSSGTEETPPPAAEQSTETGQAKPNPCDAEVTRLCTGIEPGEGRIVNCLKEHVNEVNEECRRVLGS